MYSLGIITSSDTGFKGERDDLSGNVIKEIAEKNGFKIERYVLLPDDKELISKEMLYMSDMLYINLILTTGGTGFSERDLTPEATKKVIEREALGIVEAIRMHSLTVTKRAMLSRATAGIRKKTVIVNLPGSPKACKESLEFIIDELKHGIDILLGTSK